tara:strand:- start:1165 stop:1344 length:180 start_codon:yes stop_codon:yes gene_type:complete
MKKNIFISLIFLFMCGCLVNKKENNSNNNINFSDELTFEEFSYKLEVYSKISNYPDINE